MSGSDVVVIKNFINGRFMETNSHLDSYDPSRGEKWAHVPDSDETHVDLAVAAAKDAFEVWSNTSTSNRSQTLLKIADILESRLDEFAEVESRDQGKPLSLATAMDIPRAVTNFRFFATSILHTLDVSHTMDEVGVVSYTFHSPIGVAGLISPWNLPLYLLTWKIAPAIAAGNTVVAKPSELTSATAWMLCDVFNEAGLPAGVVNMVFGTGPKVGRAIVQHPDVSVISFTGSTMTGQKIQEDSAPFCKKLSLELGGKNAAIVFDDVNLESCLPTVVRSCFANQGEVCLCSSRLFVQENIFRDFVEAFVKAARNIKVGDPRSSSTQMGALISADHLTKVRGYVALARAEGATVHCGEGVDKLDLPPELSKGYYLGPTVITNVPDTSKLMQEEIFGPVVCIVPFSTEREVICRANSVKYGLSASVWTNNLGRAHRVAQRLQVGTVWTNCWLVRDLHMPFGGTKMSGIGREGAKYSIDFFTEVKTICMKY